MEQKTTIEEEEEEEEKGYCNARGESERGKTKRRRSNNRSYPTSKDITVPEYIPHVHTDMYIRQTDRQTDRQTAHTRYTLHLVRGRDGRSTHNDKTRKRKRKRKDKKRRERKEKEKKRNKGHQRCMKNRSERTSKRASEHLHGVGCVDGGT